MKKLYWTCRETNFNRDIWYEKSPGNCGHMWFPYAKQFMKKFPWLAVRIFWLMIKTKEIWNAFIIMYPPPYPNLLSHQTDNSSDQSTPYH